MVLKNLTRNYIAYGTVDIKYIMSGDNAVLKATATCSASGITHSEAFDALGYASAGAVIGAVPTGSNVLSYTIDNLGVKIKYADFGSAGDPATDSIVKPLHHDIDSTNNNPALRRTEYLDGKDSLTGGIFETKPEFDIHTKLNLTGPLSSSNATTGQPLLCINPGNGTVSVGAEQLSGTYVSNYGTSNANSAVPLFGVAGTAFPNAVFGIDHDTGDGKDATNRTALGVRRSTVKYAIAQTAPGIPQTNFEALFGADMNYEVQDNTGKIWVLGNTSFGVQCIGADGYPEGAFSVNMVLAGDQNVSGQICNFRVTYDGITHVRGLNLNGQLVTIEPGTGYLKLGRTGQIQEHEFL